MASSVEGSDGGFEEGALLKLGLLEGEGDGEDCIETIGDADGELEAPVQSSDEGLEEGNLLKLALLEGHNEEDGWPEILGDADGELEGPVEGLDKGLEEGALLKLGLLEGHDDEEGKLQSSPHDDIGNKREKFGIGHGGLGVETFKERNDGRCQNDVKGNNQKEGSAASRFVRCVKGSN